MAIKYIINGYFRSGTTLLWKLVSESLSDTKCFYEPLHPKLSEFISSVDKDKVNELHGFTLWNEYILLDEEFKRKLIELHPNRTVERFSWNDLKKYFDFYHELDCDVLLQTNRPHHHLDQTRDSYGAKIVHIVRHPFYVYSSIIKAYKSENSGIKGVIKRSLPFGFFEAFEIQREYDWLRERLGDEYTKATTARDIFDKFCFVYCLNNYVAINAVRPDGLVLSYDRLVVDPAKQLRKLEKILLLDDGALPDSEVSSNRKENHSLIQQFEKKFEQSVKLQGLEHCYELIKKSL